ncbi:hypothetical protein NDU88_005903 [Pleurodeles waltl]|uniref:Uncharacterized protein n=1 Tax=Pleurodeles waltl TaxID=8319 RepID=A0AAV7QJK9_PLEWA|nr:hypothetical protein NDU88_005903 [Pleurodeles waltl]
MQEGAYRKTPHGHGYGGDKPTGTQILAAIEWSVQIAAMAVDVNLLRVDLRVVAEPSVATEKQVTSLQTDMDTLKATVPTLETKMRKLEVQ